MIWFTNPALQKTNGEQHSEKKTYTHLHSVYAWLLHGPHECQFVENWPGALHEISVIRSPTTRRQFVETR